MKKFVTLFSVLSIFTIAALLYSCGATPIPEEPVTGPGAITGTAELAGGLENHIGIKVIGALAGVTSTDLSSGLITTASGNFSVSTVPTGTYTLTASKYGYTSATVSVTVEDDATANVSTMTLTEDSGYSWGDIGVNHGNSPVYALELDSENIPYLAYVSGSTYYVKKYENTSWTQIGSFTVSGPGSLSLELSGSTVYFAYVSGGNSIVVKETSDNGSNWGDVGTTLNASTNPDLAIDPSTGYLHLGYVSGNIVKSAEVKHFVSETPTWSLIAKSTPQLAIDVAIQIDASGTIYEASKASLSNTIKLQKYVSGAGWSTLQSPGNTNLGSVSEDRFSIKLNSTNVLYIVFPDSDNSYKGTMKQFNGTTWSTGILFSSVAVTGAHLCFDPFEVPFVAYFESSNTTVKKLDSAAFVTVGNAITNGFYIPRVQVDGNSVPRVAASETTLSVFEFHSEI